MKRWMGMAGAVGLIAMGLVVPGVQAASKTLYVGTCKGASPYATIQSAVDAVNDDGFTIYVCPGTYNESVQVNNKEDLTIRNYVVKNQPAPLIDAGGSDGFDIFGSKEVEIRGLRITNANAAIYTFNSPETEVRNTLITASSNGVIFDQGSDKSEAQQNTISGTGNYGIGFGYNTNVTVKQNTITSFAIGVYVIQADKPKIESNTSTNARNAGIYLQNTTRASVRKNTTNFSVNGIALENSTSNTISDNTAKNNVGSGIYVENNQHNQ